MTQRRRCMSPRGFAYVEVLVATALVVTALVPALQALHDGVLRTQMMPGIVRNDSALRDKLESVIAQPYDVLSAEATANGNSPTAISATLSDPSGPDRRVVTVYLWDGTAVSGVDTGLVRVRVAWASGGIGLETLRSKWW